jgi:DNA topoisomerase-2
MAQTTLKPKTKPAASKKRPKSDSEDEQLGPEDVARNDGSVLSMTPPSAKKQKKAPVAKKTGAKPLQENQNEAFNLDGEADRKSGKVSKSSDQYQKVCNTVIYMPSFACFNQLL